MAPVLTNNDNNNTIIVLEDLFNEGPDTTSPHPDKISIWMKDKDMYQATTDVTLAKQLEPGIYTADYANGLGYYCKKLDVSSDELFIFSNSITNDLLKEINLFWSKADDYKNNNLVHKRGILLEGYPGTGKSSIISILSNEIINNGGIVFKLMGLRNLSDYISCLRDNFRKLQPDTPIISIIEDIDQYLDLDDTMLDFLDGKTHINHHVVIATTNNTEKIPDTFLRPSRLDLKIEIPLPDSKTRFEYFKNKNVPDEDIENLVKETENLSLADLKELYICIYLLDYSVKDAIDKINSPREKKNYLSSPKDNHKMGF